MDVAEADGWGVGVGGGIWRKASFGNTLAWWQLEYYSFSACCVTDQSFFFFFAHLFHFLEESPLILFF